MDNFNLVLVKANFKTGSSGLLIYIESMMCYARHYANVLQSSEIAEAYASNDIHCGAVEFLA